MCMTETIVGLYSTKQRLTVSAITFALWQSIYHASSGVVKTLVWENTANNEKMSFNLNDFNCCLILWHLVPITPYESTSPGWFTPQCWGVTRVARHKFAFRVCSLDLISNLRRLSTWSGIFRSWIFSATYFFYFYSVFQNTVPLLSLHCRCFLLIEFNNFFIITTRNDQRQYRRWQWSLRFLSFSIRQKTKKTKYQLKYCPTYPLNIYRCTADKTLLNITKSAANSTKLRFLVLTVFYYFRCATWNFCYVYTTEILLLYYHSTAIKILLCCKLFCRSSVTHIASLIDRWVYWKLPQVVNK